MKQTIPKIIILDLDGTLYNQKLLRIINIFNLVLNLILLFIVLESEIKNKYYKYYNLILDKYFLRKHK
jgi:hypothetical protein